MALGRRSGGEAVLDRRGVLEHKGQLLGHGTREPGQQQRVGGPGEAVKACAQVGGGGGWGCAES